jgi:hypothetical protein
MKPAAAILLAFLLLGASPFSAGQDIRYPAYKPGRFNIGVNYGYPSSQMVGIRAEATPKGIFGYQICLGVAILKQDFFDRGGVFHLGWSAGATAYFLGNEAKFSPFLSLLVGDVARAKSGVGRQAGWQERMLLGGELALGIRFRGAYLGYFFRRAFHLPRWHELAENDLPLGGLYFGWSFAL